MWYESTRKRLYAQFRTVGYSPVKSWRSAGIVAEFRVHECGEYDEPEIGDVRIRLEPDSEPYDPGDTLEPYWGIDGRMRSREELERELEHQLETFGVYGTIGEVWDGSEWITADNCWGHAGYNNPDCPIENPYVVDHMAQCLELRADIGEDIVALP